MMPTDVEESTDKAVLAEFPFSPSSTATRFSPFLALSFVGEELCRDDVAKGQGRAQAGLVGAHGRAQDADPPGAAREWDEVVEREHLGGLHGQVQAQLAAVERYEPVSFFRAGRPVACHREAVRLRCAAQTGAARELPRDRRVRGALLEQAAEGRGRAEGSRVEHERRDVVAREVGAHALESPAAVHAHHSDSRATLFEEAARQHIVGTHVRHGRPPAPAPALFLTSLIPPLRPRGLGGGELLVVEVERVDLGLGVA